MSTPPLYICLLLAAASSSCAALDSERNLAPLYSEHWTAGGGVGIEALGGSVLTHRPSFDAELDSWAIRPLFIHEWKEDLSRTEFLYPFGTVTRTGDEFTWNIVPIARYSRTKSPEPKSPKNFVDRYTLLVLPLGLYFSQFHDGRRVRAAFPFLGVTDGFLTFDQIEFALFPLYLRTEREGRTTWHWLFPFFSYSRTGHASLVTGIHGPFALADGDNIDLVGPAGAFSVSLDQGDFCKITNATASELADVLNANPDMQANGLRAEVVADYLSIQTEGSGPTETFQVAGGSALASLGWKPSTTVKGDNSEAWRAWPLVGHNKRDERYDRWYFLWPLFQFQKNDQRLDPDKEELSWMVFPLIGRTEQGSFRSTTILWPFIGYSTDPVTGFYSLDLPWPLVNIQEPGTKHRPGKKLPARRYRFWPIYSIYEGDGMVARSWAWPFIQHRVENYRDGVRTTFSVLPFYQSSLRSYVGEEEPTQWQRLWPLWQHEEGPNHVRSALPALNPLWHTPKLDRHYAWLWEAYSNDSKGKQSHQRSWLGLWRHEADEYEIRTSLGGLWGRRTYRSDGALTHDNSLLFGLFRWRSTEGEGADLLSPALPGPGWPLRPSTELLEPPTTGPAPLAP